MDNIKIRAYPLLLLILLIIIVLCALSVNIH
jgi:cell division protein FtsL